MKIFPSAASLKAITDSLEKVSRRLRIQPPAVVCPFSTFAFRLSTFVRFPVNPGG